MRGPEDKSSGDFNPKWPNLFNAVIESLDFNEIVMPVYLDRARGLSNFRKVK